MGKELVGDNAVKTLAAKRVTPLRRKSCNRQGARGAPSRALAISASKVRRARENPEIAVFPVVVKT
jgi:hypothetical protein